MSLLFVMVSVCSYLHSKASSMCSYLHSKASDDKNVYECSVCCQPLTIENDDDSSLVTLRCTHQFHLDCIGSSFNANGRMECPNCRRIEPGEWRYATGAPLSDEEWDDEEEGELEEEEEAEEEGEEEATSAAPPCQGSNSVPNAPVSLPHPNIDIMQSEWTPGELWPGPVFQSGGATSFDSK